MRYFSYEEHDITHAASERGEFRLIYFIGNSPLRNVKLPACGRKGWTDSPYHTDGYMALTSWSVMFVHRFLSYEGALCVATGKLHL